MKKITFTIMMAFTLLADKSFGQEFYPLNLLSLATVKNVDGKVAVRAEESDLFEKGFRAENDSLFVNEKTGEQVKIFASQKESKVKINIIYYTVATDLTRFVKRANESGLPKINDNLFENKSPAVIYSLAIKRNVSFGGKKMNILSVLVTCDISVLERLGFTPIGKTDYSYPLQNSTWYFSTQIVDDTKDKDEHLVSIKLVEDKKYNNKIVFIDDENFKVTLASKQTFTGTYFNKGRNDDQSTSIRFLLTRPVTPKGSLVRLDIPGVPQDASELKKAKNTTGYFKYFFNRDYTYKIEGQGILMKASFNENMPIVTTAPSN